MWAPVVVLLVAGVVLQCGGAAQYGSYVGCFEDSHDRKRIMTPVEASGPDMTLDLCAATCRMTNTNYTYFATKNGSECHCSVSDTNFRLVGESSACTRPCAGDGAQPCGGHWALSVYAVCPRFRWGATCAATCHCSRDSVCPRATGRCACAGNWSGSDGLCDVQRPCLADEWGATCQQKCHCLGGAPCRVSDGECPGACTHGWVTSRCDVTEACATSYRRRTEVTARIVSCCPRLASLTNTNLEDCEHAACRHGTDAFSLTTAGTCVVLQCSHGNLQLRSGADLGWDVYMRDNVTQDVSGAPPGGCPMASTTRGAVLGETTWETPTVQGGAEVDAGASTLPLAVGLAVAGVLCVVVIVIIVIVITRRRRKQATSDDVTQLTNPQVEITPRDQASPETTIYCNPCNTAAPAGGAVPNDYQSRGAAGGADYPGLGVYDEIRSDHKRCYDSDSVYMTPVSHSNTYMTSVALTKGGATSDSKSRDDSRPVYENMT